MKIHSADAMPVDLLRGKSQPPRVFRGALARDERRVKKTHMGSQHKPGGKAAQPRPPRHVEAADAPDARPPVLSRSRDAERIAPPSGEDDVRTPIVRQAIAPVESPQNLRGIVLAARHRMTYVQHDLELHALRQRPPAVAHIPRQPRPDKQDLLHFKPQRQRKTRSAA